MTITIKRSWQYRLWKTVHAMALDSPARDKRHARELAEFCRFLDRAMADYERRTRPSR